ncbi:YaaL family protein [Periweissella fabalis]|uniref:YaaL family protein n=1 Tax=Periweissella fabalis TaxID=1070421 RepID=A0A7X6N3Y6_9LACO|nr:YaaL family protein [Periweissella fabalis]MCM0598233.1 YaaL family protein [Periweissella fabalis]NKZ24832.1 YaaL family protein [Periweissella fabalis]
MKRLSKKREPLTHLAYDGMLMDQVDEAKIDWNLAKASEQAMTESNYDGRLIQAQTALAKQKFFYYYREARRRQIKGRIQRSVFTID